MTGHAAPGGPAGPFETERAARHAGYQGSTEHPGSSALLGQLHAACYRSGVELGAYDRRILEWLAGWEPATVAVIAGLITRAGQAPPETPHGA